MVINKHGSFYLRSGWGTKIIQAVEADNMIFSPANEQEAVDRIGLGRVMIKALRYWADASGLTTEEKVQGGIAEGCYVPLSWRKDFDEGYLPSIRFICLAMSEKYIEDHFSEIIGHASAIESRLSDADCTMDSLKTDNRKFINGFQQAAEQVVIIDSNYEQTIKALLI